MACRRTAFAGSYPATSRMSGSINVVPAPVSRIRRVPTRYRAPYTVALTTMTSGFGSSRWTDMKEDADGVFGHVLGTLDRQMPVFGFQGHRGQRMGVGVFGQKPPGQSQPRFRVQCIHRDEQPQLSAPMPPPNGLDPLRFLSHMSFIQLPAGEIKFGLFLREDRRQKKHRKPENQIEDRMASV